MQVKILASKHADILPGSIGTVEAIYKEPHGYSVTFKNVTRHSGKRQDVTAFFAHDEVEPLPPGEEEQVTPPTMEAKPVLKICACANPLLATVICQLDEAHKGRHRADVGIHGVDQTFLW